MSAVRQAAPVTLRSIARPHVHVFVLRSGADLKSMLTRSGGRGNARSAALARAMHSITDKIADQADVGQPRRCGCCAEPVLREGCDLGLALVVSQDGSLTTIALGICPSCSPDAAVATRNAIAAISTAIPPNAKVSTPGARHG